VFNARNSVEIDAASRSFFGKVRSIITGPIGHARPPRQIASACRAKRVTGRFLYTPICTAALMSYGPSIGRVPRSWRYIGQILKGTNRSTSGHAVSKFEL